MFYRAIGVADIVRAGVTVIYDGQIVRQGVATVVTIVIVGCMDTGAVTAKVIGANVEVLAVGIRDPQRKRAARTAPPMNKNQIRHTQRRAPAYGLPAAA